MSDLYRVHTLHVPGVDPQRDTIVAKQRHLLKTCVHEDPARKGCMATWLAALECAGLDDTEWSLILSDDADPLPGWDEHLPLALANSPEPVLGLTYFGGYGSKPLEKGVPYGVGQYLVWGGAIAYHRSIRSGLLTWGRIVVAQTGYQHDDCLIAAYALRNGFECALAARAVFGQPVRKSLLGHNTPIRKPKHTIANSDGPAWDAEPRAIRVHKQVWPEIKELALMDGRFN